MDDTKLKGDAKLENCPPGKKDMSVLQAIIEGVNCDVSTQTNRSTDNSSPSSPAIGEHISNRPSSKSKKSSFRIFIVPDYPEDGAFQDTSMRLSFDEEHLGENGQSLRFSVTSNKSKEGEETLKSRYENNEKNKRYRSTFKQGENSRKGKNTASPVSFENTNRNTNSDHHLVHSSNPSVLAWLRLKNFEEREKQRNKKKERKEKRRNAYDEAEKKQKRIEESEKRFAQWLTAKKKEARRARREKRIRKIEDIVQNCAVGKDNDPPPDYTVVPTFKGSQAWVVGEEVSLSCGKRSANTSKNNTNNNKLTLTGADKYHDNITEPSTSLEAQSKTDDQGPPSIGNVVGNLSVDQAYLDRGSSEIYDKRPATANSRLLSISGMGSKLSKKGTPEKWLEKESFKRPTTSAGRPTSNAEIKEATQEAWVMQKRKERKWKRPITAPASHGDSECVKKPYKKSITFETWKAQKIQEIKVKKKDKKRQEVDDAMTEAILKMGRKRVDNSFKEKRQLDTGMPKWRAKNRVGSSSEKKRAGLSDTSSNKYEVINFLTNENDEEEKDKQLNEVAAIQKFCEDLTLD
ncbi:DNA ligase 1-like [Dendronephthya gigantea]|uniref:DNA ligase 1-like n=1 Tax=Dendronephthya gigantea TaxID=151771 RepID=UPI00106BEB78|nr:DNA ligase 1-like [Dendronephthya gigantea]